MTTDEYWHTIEESYREKSQEPCEDAISRQAAIEAIRKDPMGGLNYEGILTRLPSVTPKYTEITLESAIDYLNSIGWMQEHDRILTESAQNVTPKQRTGHWEWVQYDYNPKLGDWHCSECRCVVVECVNKEEEGGIPLYRYCPQCGARMVEPQESDHKCHTCKHYTSGENDGSCGSYICKGYSNWESEG